MVRARFRFSVKCLGLGLGLGFWFVHRCKLWYTMSVEPT